jgi:hypothetical protein
MAYTKTAEIGDAVKGGWIEVGTFTLDPASIAAAAQGIETVTITGIKAGDNVFLNAQAAPLMAIVAGCKVTADDTLSVYLNNAYDATTAVNIGSLTWDVLIIHNS